MPNESSGDVESVYRFSVGKYPVKISYNKNEILGLAVYVLGTWLVASESHSPTLVWGCALMLIGAIQYAESFQRS